MKFAILQNLLSGTEAEFHQIFNNLCAQNRTWKVWHRCLHEDLFTYVCHFISFRTGNWPLRMACIKHMAKMSQICGSTYYNRLLPQHLSDIECYPKEIIDHLKMGGFSMNISLYESCKI